jgi:hypothetical protein
MPPAVLLARPGAVRLETVRFAGLTTVAVRRGHSATLPFRRLRLLMRGEGTCARSAKASLMWYARVR